MLSKFTNLLLIGAVLVFALATPSSAQTAPAEQDPAPFVSTSLTPPSVLIGETSIVAVNLNNVPTGGFASAEFTCSYNPAVVEVSAITPADLFGPDPIAVVNGPQNGSFIFAVAGSLGNKATADGTVFTFSAKGLQVGQAAIDCQVRASTGDLVLGAIPSTPSSLDVAEDVPVPTQGTFAGQVIAGKPVTVTLTDQTGLVAGSVVANPDGTFSLSLPAGTYTAVASAPGFLRAQGMVNIENGSTTTIQKISLLAGDIDGNDVIDNLDALTIGINYNGTEPAAADLSNDGTINVLELEILSPNYRQVGPLDLLSGNSPSGTASPPPSPNPTNTGVPPVTATATVAPPQPNPTSTQVSGSIAPFASAPLCPTHNPNQWHGIWDYERGCHYDHEHGDDPALADKYFGPLGAYWNGTTISHPFPSSPMENTMKHNGYKVQVNMPEYHPWPKCGTEDNTDITGDHSDNCVVASRIEYHGVGALVGLLTRYHSVWIELYICKGHPQTTPLPNDPNCGVFRTGSSLVDFGQLQAPHYNARVFRAGGTVDFGNGMVMNFAPDGSDLPSTSGEPYIFGIPSTELDVYQRNSPHGDLGTNPGSYKATIDQWSSNDFDCEPRPAGDPCHNIYFHYMFQVGDSFNLVDTNNPYNPVWICYPQVGCEYDGSMHGMNEVAARILPQWDADGDGRANMNGFSDRFGNPISGCNTPSPDCVPFILENVPVGVAASRQDNGCECNVWEYDIYFNGKPSGWIKFPN